MAAPDSAVPTPDKVRMVLRQLVGRDVTVKDGKPLVLGPSTRGYWGAYRDDSGALAVACVMDLPLAANIAAALAMMPIGQVNESVRAGALNPGLLDNLREVMNVAASIFNRPGRPHVSLREVQPCPPALPADVTGLLGKPNFALHLDVAIAGYGGGRLSLVG